MTGERVSDSGRPVNPDRALHVYVLAKIEGALGDRSWSWLAEKSGVARSTLISQAERPKFSLNVLMRVAKALERDIAYFLPANPDTQPPTPDDPLSEIAVIVARARRNREADESS